MKILRTASLGSNFTGSFKKREYLVFSFCYSWYGTGLRETLQSENVREGELGPDIILSQSGISWVNFTKILHTNGFSLVNFKIQKQPLELFCKKKIFLKISQISQEDTGVGVCFYKRDNFYKLLKKETPDTGVFMRNCQIFKNTYVLWRPSANDCFCILKTWKIYQNLYRYILGKGSFFGTFCFIHGPPSK